MSHEPGAADTPEYGAFRVDVPEAVMEDLRRRLASTRFAPSFPGDGWQLGTDADYLRDLVAYWALHEGRLADQRDAVLGDRDVRELDPLLLGSREPAVGAGPWKNADGEGTDGVLVVPT